MSEEHSHTEKKSVYDLEVKVRSLSSPSIIELLKETILGTPGKLRYRNKNIIERVKSHFNIEFIQIMKGRRLFGTVGIVKRMTNISNVVHPALYVRYLSISKAFSNTKYSSKSKSKKTASRKSVLREEISDSITNHFEQPFKDKNEEASFYAYVETHNSNSFNLCTSMGFKPYRTVDSLLFSRFNPKISKNIVGISEEDQELVTKHLDEFYSGYTYYFDDRVFNTGFYFVYKKGDEILGGIRVNPVNWEIVENPGLDGWLMQSVLPFFPFTDRIFKPEEFNFLAFDYIWHAPGEEHKMIELMNHCCALFNINTGIIWGDQQSPAISYLNNSGKLGFLHSIKGAVSAYLMIRSVNLNSTTKNKLSNNPVFVSSLDMV